MEALDHWLENLFFYQEKQFSQLQCKTAACYDSLPLVYCLSFILLKLTALEKCNCFSDL